VEDFQIFKAVLWYRRYSPVVGLKKISTRDVSPIYFGKSGLGLHASVTSDEVVYVRKKGNNGHGVKIVEMKERGRRGESLI